jgi:hypothetical protein
MPTFATLHARIKDAVRASFPSRAGEILRVVERTLWYGSVRHHEQIGVVEMDGDGDPPQVDEICAACGRFVSYYDHPPRTVIGFTSGVFVALHDYRRFERGEDHGPAALVCGSCLVLARTEHEDETVILVDVMRALRATGAEDADALVAELERRIVLGSPPKTSRSPCVACRSSAPERSQTVAGLCAPCWSVAREAAR